MVRRLWPLLSVIIALACMNTTEPGADQRNRVPALHVMRYIQSACTKVWTGGSGSWSSTTAWSPWGVPGATDVACILAPSGTIVSVQSRAEVRELIVGDGVNDVRIECSNATGDFRPVRAWVRTGATLDASGCATWGTLVSDYLEVDGTLRADAASALGPDTMLVHGSLDLASATVYTNALTLTINSRVRTTGSSLLYVVGPVNGFYADVIGSGRLTVRGGGGAITYGGGSAPLLPPGANAALRFQDIDVTIINAPSGSVEFDLQLLPRSLHGDVPAGLDLRLTGVRDIRWNPLTGAVVTNDGSVTSSVDVLSAPSIRNRGRLRFSASADRLATDSIVNAMGGQVDIEGALVLDRPLTRWRNSGVVNVSNGAQLEMRGGSFGSEVTGRMGGTLRLTAGALLTGAGTVGDVVVDSGHVTPGTAAQPRASISIGALTLGAGATVLLDVEGTTAGSFDDLTVRAPMVAGGTLEVRTVAPFVGGACGQVIPLIRYLGTRTGNFQRTLGLSLAPDRAWRVGVVSNTWWLTGADPARQVGTSVASLAVAEGGASSVVYHCLGWRPTADVDVTLSASRSQVDVTPVVVSFPAAAWELPQFAIVAAIDDVVAEGTHTDTLRYTLASADPAFNGAASTQLPVTVADNDAAAAVDLAVSLVSVPATVNANQVFVARFRVVNAGPAASSGSTFSIAPMAGFTYLANQSNVTCTPGGSLLTCTVGALAAGDQVEFFLELRASAAGSYANTVRIAGLDYDPVVGNDTLVWNFTVN